MPKRRIVYRLEAEQLFVESEKYTTGVTIHHNGQKLAEPHAIFLGVGNDGRRDIPSTAFDSGKPIIFDFEAPIVEISHQATKPDGVPLSEMTAHLAQPVAAAEAKIEVSGTTLRIGPSLMASRQIIMLSLLIDGQPRVSISNPPVDVRVLNNRVVLEKQRRFAKVLRALALMVAAVSVALPIASTPRLGFAIPLAVFGAFLVAVAVMADTVTRLIVGRAMTPVDNSI
ncbi:hypothetical protein RMN56_12800 [Micromonospora halotolerans]|uniref:Uncharacterized protein n=1 Tax=Micromonospora halotolerans TaxID=709879 RepID=A0ABZ0A3Y1_9ACTN|nr:hypothetical protein [Micromonospora halotolerans]WNM42149.1 hypothetical protein RMN56_12800 [Micromonospora halotolerans]